MKRKVAINKDNVPMIFQVRSSRATAFQSTFSSLSAISVFRPGFSGFFLGLFSFFFFSLLAMSAKILSLYFVFIVLMTCRLNDPFKLSRRLKVYLKVV